MYVIKIFLSSSFLDMHGERNMIMRYIESKINEQVMNRNVRVHFIDLRYHRISLVAVLWFIPALV